LVRFWFYKPETERTELKKTGKKPSQTGKKPNQTGKNRANPNQIGTSRFEMVFVLK
jgi:hypothetical protein